MTTDCILVLKKTSSSTIIPELLSSVSFLQRETKTALEKTLECDRSNENSHHSEACELYIDVIQVTCMLFPASLFVAK